MVLRTDSTAMTCFVPCVVLQNVWSVFCQYMIKDLKYVGIFGNTLRYLNVTHKHILTICIYTVTYVLIDCMNSPIVQSEHQTADLLWSLHSHMTHHFLWHVVEHPVQSPGHFLSVQPHVQPQVSSAHRVEGCCDVSKRHNVHWKHTNTQSHGFTTSILIHTVYLLYIHIYCIYCIYTVYLLYIHMWTFVWSFS